MAHVGEHNLFNSRAIVKNTFLEFQQEDGAEGDDPWVVSSDVRRQHTDSVVRGAIGTTVRSNVEQRILDTLRGHLGQLESRRLVPPSLTGPCSPTAASNPRVATPPVVMESALSGRLSSLVDPAGYGEPTSPQAQAEERCGSDNDEEDDDDGESDSPLPLALMTPTPTTNDAPACGPPPTHGDAGDEGSLKGATTVMMRNVPIKYTQRRLMREINAAGFLGRYDFFYVPMDPRSRSNRGFAFCNFDGPETAELFRRTFLGSRLKLFSAEKDLAIVPADIQGFAANAEHYANSRTNRRRRDIHSPPLFLRPLEPHLRVDDGRVQVLSQQALQSYVDQPSGPAPLPAARGQQRPRQRHAQFGGQQLQQSQLVSPSPLTHVNLLPMQQPHPYPQQLQRATRFCPFCGRPKQFDYLYCPYCGHQVPTNCMPGAIPPASHSMY